MIDGLELRRDEFTVRVDSFAQSRLHSWRIKLEIFTVRRCIDWSGWSLRLRSW